MSEESKTVEVETSVEGINMRGDVDSAIMAILSTTEGIMGRIDKAVATDMHYPDEKNVVVIAALTDSVYKLAKSAKMLDAVGWSDSMPELPIMSVGGPTE